jgi:hypothetical protein
MEDTQGRANSVSGLHTVQAGATSPLVRALISGAFVGGLVLLITLQNRVRSAGYWGVYGFLITSGLVWTILQLKFSKIVYWIEEKTGQEINNDNVIGEPVEEPSGVTITVRDVSDKGGLSIFKYEFEMIGEEQLIAFANGTADGGSLSESSWCGSGRPFSKPKFLDFRDELERRSWAVSKGGSQGFELTRAGKAVMREIVRESSTHSPTDADAHASR